MTMQHYPFDDAVLTPGRFRFHVLRTRSVGSYRKELVERQQGICPLCNGARGPLDRKTAHVDHIKTVKEFAYDLTIPLTKAYLECHDINNLRAVHRLCHRERKSNGG